jgi:UPF0755 protein
MKKLFILIIIIILAVAGFYFWWQNGISPVDTQNNDKKTFVVAQGEGTREITEKLKNSGLIRDPVVFYLLIKQLGESAKIQAGVFYLSPSMPPSEILRQLQVGKFDIAVTVPEGKRAEEIADIFVENFSGFNEEWRERLNSEEGYLFPDTYYFPKEAGIDQIITVMKNNFAKKYSEVTNNTSLTKEEIVILASLIEREAKHAVDRPLVSSVIHNRLDIGMKLDIDATVQYALGYDISGKRWWKERLTYDDLKLDSVYNTYTNPGLPPGPISNPGLASLAAAANPDDTNYIFYLSDKQGNNHYATSLEEHRQNIDTYLK